MRSMLVQRDIADALNLSPATVSRALRNDSAIPPKTRARVVELAARGGYRPPVRSHKPEIQNESMALGVLIQTNDPGSTVQSIVAQGFLSGMCHCAHELSISVNVHYVSLADEELIADKKYQPAFMRDNSVKGILFIHRFPDNTVRKLAEKWPCVVLSNRVPSVNADYVSADDALAMHDITELLAGQGHGRICFVAFWRAFAWEYSRMSGFTEAQLAGGKELCDIDHIWLDTPVNRIPVDLDKHLKKQLDNGVTAFVCVNDVVGYEVVRTLLKMKVDVPRDVSVTGFDGLPAPHGLPHLTSAIPAFDQMGIEAVKCLRYRIDNPTTPIKHIQVRSKIVDGETVCLPKNNK